MAATVTNETTVQPKYIYASGADLQNALKNYGNNNNYKIVDVSSPNFNASQLQTGGIMLGGNKVNTNISDDLLQSKGVHRVAGVDSQGTSSALTNALNTGFAAPQSGVKYVYGSGQDLQNAQNIFSPGNGYKLVDVSSPNFDPATMQSGGVMLGGNGVNTNITDNMLNRLGIQRVAGQDAQGTANAAENYYWDSQKPTLPTQAAIPTLNPFSFTGTMQDYLDQAQTLMAPQKQLAEQSINDSYDTNYIPQANNDTLSRGLARSSYAGNRVDQINANRSKELTNADLQIAQQANNIGMQNYNQAYDRAYQQWKDNNTNTLSLYGLQNDANQQNFNNAMNLYNANRGDYWNKKNYNADQANKEQQQANWQKQFDTTNSQWQQQFNAQQSQNAFDNSLKQAQLALSQAKAASGGSRGGGSGRSSSSSSSKLTAADKSNVQMTVMSQLQNAENEGLGRNYLVKYKDDIINTLGDSFYKSLVKEADQHAEQGGLPSEWSNIQKLYK